MKMKILCILQNAWGPRALPMVFTPSRFNKSAKRMYSICEPHTMHFSNTTLEMTTTAKGKCKPDIDHVKKLLMHAYKEYDLLIVCGKQAKECVSDLLPKLFGKSLGPVTYYMQHPASRTLTNKECQEMKEEVIKQFTIWERNKLQKQ